MTSRAPNAAWSHLIERQFDGVHANSTAWTDPRDIAASTARVPGLEVLNRASNGTHADPTAEAKARIRASAAGSTPSTREGFAQPLKREARHWAKLARVSSARMG